MGSSKTRLGLSATSRGRYGSFAGKTEESVTTTLLDFERGMFRGGSTGMSRGMG